MKDQGHIVETKNNGRGKTKNSDPVRRDGKVLVYLENSRLKLLCKIENLKFIGFYD